MRQDTKTRTLQSGDARNVALNFCDLRRSRSFDLWFYGIHFDLTNSWPRTNNGQVMLTSEFSPCRSYRKIEVLYGFVLACFGPTMTPQPLPSQLFLAQTSKRRHRRNAAPGLVCWEAFLLWHATIADQEMPRGHGNSGQHRGHLGLATDGTKLIPSP